MNIAILSDTTLWGGLETHAVSLTRGLTILGHRTRIVCTSAACYALYRSHAPSDVEVVALQPPAHASFAGWYRALAAVRADAVILEKGTLRTGSLAMDLALRARFSRFIAIMHLEPEPLPPRRWLFDTLPVTGLWWYRWKLTGLLRSLGPRFTMCVSEAVRRRLTGDYAFAPRRVVTVANGVDASEFEPDDSVRLTMRREWGLSADAFVFGAVARLTRVKGFDVAIKAFARVVAAAGKARPDVYLVLVGTGEEQAALASEARDLGIEGRVLFPGFTSNPRRAYQALDVFLIPSRQEAMPLSLLEAMACGCMAIGTRVGGIPEVITDQDLGVLVESENVDALAEAMSVAFHLPTEARQAFGARARTHVAENFDVRKHWARVAQLVA